MIKVENLVKAFGAKLAVNDVSFTVERGEVLGFLGPNGAGKSTTMRMITGFIPPSSGRITIGGHDMLEDPLPAKRLIGYLPENAPGYADMTVLGFLNFAETHFVSAKDGKGLGPLLRSVDGAYAAAMARLPTPKLTRAMMAAVERQQPPIAGRFRPKLRYAHQGGINPPRIIVHGNSLDQLPESYRRYLEGWFRDTFKLRGTPMRVEFRTGRNPYAGRGPAPRRSKAP